MASKSTASSDSPLAEGAGVLIGGGQRHSARFTSSSDDSPQLPLNNGIFAATNTNSTSKKRLVSQNTKANLNTKTTTTTINSNGKLNRSFTSLNLSASSLPSSSSKRQHTNSTSSSSHIATNHHGHSRSKPAELYRTDFITAMKIPDTEVIWRNIESHSQRKIKNQFAKKLKSGLDNRFTSRCPNSQNFEIFH